MADVQQVLLGMVELNNTVVQAEERAAEAERQAQSTQQDLARAQQTPSKGKKSRPAPTQLEQGVGAFASKYQPKPFDCEDDRWRGWVRMCHNWSGRFFGGALAEIHEHLESHITDPATVNDLEPV